MRAGYLGPEGTNTHEALVRSGLPALEPVPCPTILAVIEAVARGDVELGLVPIENALEGSVNATLDGLAAAAGAVQIAGERIHPIRTCLIAATTRELPSVARVVSHPQANAQCAAFLARELPGVPVLAAASTAEAVRTVAAHPDEPWAALGPRFAAELYGGTVLRGEVDDAAGNETRFAWLVRDGAHAAALRETGAGGNPDGGWKTAIAFWGAGSEAPGWLVGCLSEFARREVNLNRIESRPRRQGLGRYMFFVDCDGHAESAAVRDALAGVAARVETLLVLGCFPAAAG